jgi:phosphohistidine phosphatase
MEIHLLRHAIAALRGSEDYPESEDHLRPLTRRGKSRMRKAAQGMRHLGLDYDLVLTSPYVRARETAEIVAKTLDVHGKIAECPYLVPGADPDALLAHLGEWKRSRATLLVGHEPHLGAVASVFLGGMPGLPLAFRKGGLARFDFAGVPGPGAGQLVWWLTPKQLRLLGESGRRGRGNREP